MDSDVVRIAQVFTVIGTFLVVILFTVFGCVVALRRMSGKRTPGNVGLTGIDEARFTRLEQAVDTIAVEVERITEGQRFTTKLMTERAQENLPAPAPAPATEQKKVTR